MVFMRHLSKEDQETYFKTILIISLALACFILWLWWARVYTSKSSVFRGMLLNNLSTRGFTKSLKQEEAGESLQQVSQIQFGGQYLANVKTDIVQPAQGGEIKVSTQTLSTPTEDYVRYTSVDMPQVDGAAKRNFSSLTSIWGKSIKAEGGGSTFLESIYGIVPFGNLPSKQRNELLAMIHSKDVYKTDFSKTEVKQEDDRTVYVYDVEVNLRAYAEVIKSLDKTLNLKQMDKLNPDDYQNADPVKIKLTIDKLSRRLTKIYYQEEQRQEEISGYGISKNIDLPKDTISSQELEGRLQQIMQAEQ